MKNYDDDTDSLLVQAKKWATVCILCLTMVGILILMTACGSDSGTSWDGCDDNTTVNYPCVDDCDDNTTVNYPCVFVDTNLTAWVNEQYIPTDHKTEPLIVGTVRLLPNSYPRIINPLDNSETICSYPTELTGVVVRDNEKLVKCCNPR